MNHELTAPLGDLFRERRTLLRMTMREVAGTELSPTAVNNIEKGKIKPTVETILYLCRVLDLPPEQALIRFPDFTKSAAALFEIVDDWISKREFRQAHTLLFDMYWVGTEQKCERLLGDVQFRLGLVFFQLGRYACARDSMNQAYICYLEHKVIDKKIQALYQAGNIELAEGNTNVAIAMYRQALVVVNRYLHVDSCVGEIQYQLAAAHLQNLDYRLALQASRAAENVYRTLGVHSGIARSVLQQAELLMQMSALPEAEVLATEAYSYFAEHGDVHLARAARVLGDLMTALERYDEAHAHFATGAELLGDTVSRERWALSCSIAELSLRLQDLPTARSQAQAALAICDGDPIRLRAEDRALAYRLLARCDLQADDVAGYVRLMQAAIAALTTGGYGIQAALLQTELADETNDWDLLREASRTLRFLQKRPR
ncbi:helix-turn-helix transcriptional regulator [Tumebacillus sp. ITR2]|uniref:Helix-turn-helix transcriptional regulator n=1 Tax=Tumebacillus amylolyticus TaxID=2801339 RepID=A0ABS1JG61_9BACL|nr:helix-turn-helix transcriptional regulator [Tumebacillus amylolyticus]MBL0389264.1 helix-turn-helix transcriptional regulator [Tumebacillus amylolyticus]